MASEWQAHVREEWERQRVRLMVGRNVGDQSVEMLMGDGTWMSNPAAVVTEGAGIVLPTDAVPALLDALRAFVGERGPSEGEVRVLREWLGHERARVDALMPPREASRA